MSEPKQSLRRKLLNLLISGTILLATPLTALAISPTPMPVGTLLQSVA